MSSASVTSRDESVARDCVDPLRDFRDRFVIPEGLIYLDGNSLGPMPRAAASVLSRTIEQEWGDDLIRSWNTAGWFDMPVRLGDRIGTLIGAAPGQTLVCDTTSINLYKAIHAAIGMRPDRDVVIAEDESFPTDLYIVEGAMKSAGRPMKRRLIGTDGPSIEALLDRKVAVAVLSHVNYRTGALLDVAAITRQLHDAGALVVWDLCHSIGVVEFAFDLHAVDFAVGCTYKYLNGGPGSPPLFRSQQPIRPPRNIRYRAGGAMPPPLRLIVTSGPTQASSDFCAELSRSSPCAVWTWRSTRWRASKWRL